MNVEEVPGNGAKLNIHCNGGCIIIQKIRYTCKKEKDTVQKQNQKVMADQLKKVKTECEGKESCSLSATRKFFGSQECPKEKESNMFLWVIYGCKGGQDQTTMLQ